MQNRTQFEQLWKQFGEQLGFDELILDDEGQCLLIIGERPVSISHREQCLRFEGFLAELAGFPLPQTCWRGIAIANFELLKFGSRSSIVLDEETDCLTLISEVTTGLDLTKLIEFFEAYLLRLESIRAVLEDALKTEPGERAGSEKVASSPEDPIEHNPWEAAAAGHLKI